MERDTRITEAIFKAVDELNKQLPKERRLQKSMNTALAGQRGKLDSLALINLIVITEQTIEEQFNVSITLADEEALSGKAASFESIGSLINHVSSLLDNRGHAADI